jgi:hypothetical protein
MGAQDGRRAATETKGPGAGVSSAVQELCRLQASLMEGALEDSRKGGWVRSVKQDKPNTGKQMQNWQRREKGSMGRSLGAELSLQAFTHRN